MKTYICTITQEIVDNTDYSGFYGEIPCYADQAIMNATGVNLERANSIRIQQVEYLPSTCGNECFDYDLQGLDSNLDCCNRPSLPLVFEITIEE